MKNTGKPAEACLLYTSSQTASGTRESPATSIHWEKVRAAVLKTALRPGISMTEHCRSCLLYTSRLSRCILFCCYNKTVHIVSRNGVASLLGNMNLRSVFEPYLVGFSTAFDLVVRAFKGELLQIVYVSVSYTHLDVYKRQLYRRQ